MTNIAFLACPTTLPGSTMRREDAHEHDLQIAAFTPAFAAEGLTLKVIDWHAPMEDFENIELALLGTAWDYQDVAPQFLAKLEQLQSAGIDVCNTPEIVRWNITKTYLRELEMAGAATIPTLWVDRPGAAAIDSAFEHFGTDAVVVKRQVGAGAFGQHRFIRACPPAADWQMDRPAMIQPFLPQIAHEGEISFIFIDGELSHALVKRAAKGDYRIQSLYGGFEEAITPSIEDGEAARSILAHLPFPTPLYARIDMLRSDMLRSDMLRSDMLRSDKGALLLMEAELIEPYLYPEQGPQLGPMLAKAIARKVSNR